jgi:hypothetical protein
VKDADGRQLRSIREAGRHQMVLNYEMPLAYARPGVPQQHVELVNFP